MEKLFGTDGIRGVAGNFPLDDRTIQAVARSLTTRMSAKLGRGPRLVIGRDTRESGADIEKAFTSGAADGTECTSAGVITTPGVAFLTSHFGFDAGVVISASHNPFEDNGIKIFAPSGKKIEESAERQIEGDVAVSENASIPEAPVAINNSRTDEFRSAYLSYLAKRFPGLSLAGKKIVVDCANGASSAIAPELFCRLGAEVIAIHDKPNGRNINANCGSLHLEGLQHRVALVQADLGVAFDGDADRSLFVDEQGSLVDGDTTLWILARYFEKHGGLSDRKVVATVMSNIGLEIALASQGINLVRTAVGDKYVLEELLRLRASLGGEQSGHIIIPQNSLVGDGIMTTLFVLETMFEEKKSLSELSKGFTRYPQTLLNVKVKQKLPFENVPPIADAVKRLESELNGNGRLLLRYSGTENLARVMIEGKEQQVIEQQARSLADIISETLG